MGVGEWRGGDGEGGELVTAGWFELLFAFGAGCWGVGH